MHQKDKNCEKVIIKANLTEMLVQYKEQQTAWMKHFFYKLNLANSNHIGDLHTLYTVHFTKKRLACSETSVFSLDIAEHA